MFHTEGEYTKTKQNNEVEKNQIQKAEYEDALSDFRRKGLTQMHASGGISRLMRIFAQVIHLYEQAKEPPLEITLVGHSMGTIILNEMVRKYDSVWILNEEKDSLLTTLVNQNFP